MIRPSTITRIFLSGRLTTVILIMTPVEQGAGHEVDRNDCEDLSSWETANRDARPRHLADLRNRLRAALNAELFHATAKRAGIEVQQRCGAVGSFNSPVGSHQNVQNVIAFHLINAMRRKRVRTLFL